MKFTLLSPFLFFHATALTVAAERPLPKISVERLPQNPIITPAMLAGDDGDCINGPSLIRVPAWVKNPLGKYYLYFAHHA